jgi:uncharacterized repeat protein (TIGR01451 family)
MARLRGFGPWMLILIPLMVSIQFASGALPPSIDMSVNKTANDSITDENISEVEAGSAFYYNISVKNPSGSPAPDVVVTDKLPYSVGYINTTAYGADGETVLNDINVTINKTGDLLYVRYLEPFPADTTFYIRVNVTAPTDAPDTLYNIVNLRYANDPDLDNNTVTLATYVPVTGYNKELAIESFEELLHNQTRLLFDFEDLLHTTPRTGQENYTFIASFEPLLRAQANLSLSFEDLLENESVTGWDDANISPGFQAKFLKSFNQIIWDEAFLFASYEMKLKDAWMSLDGLTAPNHSQDMQTEFIASFESLLKDQVKLFDSYQLLMKTINTTDIDVKVDAFAAFENLLRVQANLLMSFEDVLKMKYHDPLHESIGSQLRLTVRSRWLDFSQLTCQYTITVSNIGNTTANLANLTSSYQFAYDSTTGQVELLLAEGQSPGWADTIDGQSAHYEDPLPTLNPGESREFKMTLHVFPLEVGKLHNDITVESDGES